MEYPSALHLYGAGAGAGRGAGAGTGGEGWRARVSADNDEGNVYASVEMGASTSHGSLYGLSARARAGGVAGGAAAGAGVCRHTQTLEFNERGARPAPQPEHVCTMPRARGGVRVEVRGARLGAPGVELELPPCLLLLRAACSCHLLPESHRRHQGRTCCEASGGGVGGGPPSLPGPAYDDDESPSASECTPDADTDASE